MGIPIPKSECAFKTPSRRKEEQVSPVMQEAAKSVAGKSEVRSKSQTKEKQELRYCGGRKDTDSIAVLTGTIADHSRRWQQ